MESAKARVAFSEIRVPERSISCNALGPFSASAFPTNVK